ncbi:SDR family oxidoreductase [Mycolicibacterium obuense]|uniref:SDR family oxidoreductase n=1 Tax=Mycolicibacterium obuense TaxID=1807 RepID=A0A4R5X6T0_9MYCO|nr:SDR family oxidoreductase [Mycolicibacterium obuense]TDL07504.1 SDR family oxidoreductase [Mycolicibacterium obuense]
MTTYAVTGATGQLGSLAVAALLDRGVAPADLVAIVRDPNKAVDLRDRGIEIRVADYGDADAVRTALEGVQRLLLVSGSEIGSRVPQHATVIDAAKVAGVGLIAYTSILDAPNNGVALAREHVETERLLAASGLDHIVLRNGWYSENYTAALQSTIDGGVLYGAAGDGKVALASRADYAAAAAAAIIDGTPRVYELAGDEHLTYADIAATIAEVSGRPVRYQDLPQAAYAEALASNGIPAPINDVLADSDAAVARGEIDTDATDLADLVGTTTPFREVVRAAL